jgi:signal transduction histidine kinase
LANVGQHAHAAHARISLTREAAAIVVEVADDGRGGVVEAGGLSGLGWRIAAFDGHLEITSPTGGPHRPTRNVTQDDSHPESAVFLRVKHNGLVELLRRFRVVRRNRS